MPHSRLSADRENALLKSMNRTVGEGTRSCLWMESDRWIRKIAMKEFLEGKRRLFVGVSESVGRSMPALYMESKRRWLAPAIYFFNNACHLWLLRTKLFAIRFTRLKNFQYHPLVSGNTAWVSNL
jgi:hypothetical protein